jgi:hypothetical protein
VLAFTVVQVLVLAAIFGVTVSPAAIAFPVLIVALVPLRFWLLPRYIPKAALDVLDPVLETGGPPAAAPTPPLSRDENPDRGVQLC